MQVRSLYFLCSLLVSTHAFAMQGNFPRIETHAIKTHKERIASQIRKKKIIKVALIGAAGIMAGICLLDFLKGYEEVTLPDNLKDATLKEKDRWLIKEYLRRIDKNTYYLPESDGLAYAREWIIDWKAMKQYVQLAIMVKLIDCITPSILRTCGLQNEDETHDSPYDSIQVFTEKTLKMPIMQATLAYYAWKYDENPTMALLEFKAVCGHLKPKIESLLGLLEYRLDHTRSPLGKQELKGIAFKIQQMTNSLFEQAEAIGANLGDKKDLKTAIHTYRLDLQNLIDHIALIEQD